MSAPLVLAGAGGLAYEVIEAARAGGLHHPVAVLDDDVRRHGSHVLGVPVVGGIDAVGDFPEARVVVCAGRGSTRRRLVDRLGPDPSRYATVVHPSVCVPASAHIGAGSVLLAGCVLTAAVRLGRHVVLMPNVTCTHDDVVGDYVTLCAGVTLGGGVQVGEAAYLGMRVAVRENVRIGSDAQVGMGAVILRDVPSAQTWVGVPGRPLAPRAPGVPV